MGKELQELQEQQETQDLQEQQELREVQDRQKLREAQDREEQQELREVQGGQERQELQKSQDRQARQEQQEWQDQQERCESSCSGTKVGTALRERQLAEETVFGVAELFKALGDPTRVKIIYTLLQRELCVHDLSEALDMGQSAVSHQLRYLRNLHIVKRRKEGKTVYYSLDDMHIEQIFVQTLQHLQHM